MGKPTKQIDSNSLVAFGNVAAGHEGVMSDADGLLVIKPCKQIEIDFYQSAAASHPDFAAFMPTFMGSLTRGGPDAATSKEPPAAQAETAATLSNNDPGPMHGKAIDTDLCIVLENIAAGFTKPNILDVKLGARLWDDEAPLSKRARLDDVAAKSTSSTLGFRIAGMQTWRPDRTEEAKAKKTTDGQPQTGKSADEEKKLWEHDHESHYSKYNKMYGRSFTADNKHEGFQAYLGLEEYFQIDDSDKDESKKKRAEELLDYFIDQVRSVQKILEHEESRMYSASILFVYEGDLKAYHATKKHLSEHVEKEDKEEEDDDDEEEQLPKIAAIKLIDFAHAKWTPGEGPDENVLHGVRGVISTFEKVRRSLGN